MSDAPSILSLAAAAFYALVVAACVMAGLNARQQRQQPWHTKAWWGIAAFFVLLILSRVFGLEDTLRSDMREWLRSEALIEGRRAWQGIIVAAFIIAFVAAGSFALYRLSRLVHGRRNQAVAAALLSVVVMLTVIALRLVSLHSMDKLLFGPLKLNWIGDLGASAMILAAAAYYVNRIRQRPPPPRSARR